MSSLPILVFLLLVAGTLVITYWSAKRVKTENDFYAAGRRIKGWQNGLAIVGEFLTAAAFLGIGGLISFFGVDGQIYSITWFASYFVVLMVIAEPIRNSGKYTFDDIVSYRLNERLIRPLASINAFLISLMYLIPQMVAAGALAKLLFGISASTGLIIVGVLMIIYITFGGMVAATWIQVLKAIMLLTGAYILAFLILRQFHFSVNQLFSAVAHSGDLGPSWLEPGRWLKTPVERLSLGFTLLFGTAALPHVLMRFYTVPTKQHAQGSAMWSLTFMFLFHILTFIFGLGAAVLVGNKVIKALDAGGNIAVPLLARKVAGGEGTLTGELFMAYLVAVAFITIIAATSGLCIAASSAFSYDFWFKVVKRGNQSHQGQMRTARLAAFGIGVLAIAGGLLLRQVNVAYLAGLAFAIAATANLPTLIFALYWKGLTTKGAIIGMLGGALVAVACVVTGPTIMGKDALFPLANPGIVCVPIGFLLTYLGSVFTRDPDSELMYKELAVRSRSGLGAES
jgi:cation/acetate symporter